MNSEENKSSLIVLDEEIQEFKQIIDDIVNHSSVASLREHKQHLNSSRFEHCYDVAYYTYKICKKWGLDYVSAARGAMLHDFYFYDWRHKGVKGQKRFHAYRHPRIAWRNANENFELNEVEKDVIIKHMWPLTWRLPRYKESYIVTFVDKYCATKEFFDSLKYGKKIKKTTKLKKAKEVFSK